MAKSPKKNKVRPRTSKKMRSTLDSRVIAILYRPSTTLAIQKSEELATWLQEQGSEVLAVPGQNWAAESSK
jgi:hypothetical protein